MFHMLTCFNLQSTASIGEFQQRLVALTAHMQSVDLVHKCEPIGRRQKHPVMDTDDERDHEYFFIMSFHDRAQCDRAVDYIQSQDEPARTIHDSVYAEISDPVFICWEDI